VFTGELRVSDSNAYTFTLRSDDGSRLFIDGQQVVTNDGLHGMSTVKQATVRLTKGTHRFRLEFFQLLGAKGLSLSVACPVLSEQVQSAYELAVKAQPLNYAAWDEYGRWLSRCRDVPERTWRNYHDAVLKALLPDYPEVAWKLISKYAYPPLLAQSDLDSRIQLFLKFHRGLKGWGATGRWDFEQLLASQFKQLGHVKPDASFQFLQELMSTLSGVQECEGALLAWAFDKFGRDAKQREQFFQAVRFALGKSSGSGQREGAQAVLAMASKALLEAEKAKDAELYREVGQIIERAVPAEQKKKKVKPELPGRLLSYGALTLFNSLSSRYDKPSWRHWFIGSDRPGFFHSNNTKDPYVELVLPHFGELTGIVIVNRNSWRSRAVPLKVEVSTDGKTWKQVALFKKAQRKWVIDLRGKRIRARRVRVTKVGQGILHLQNVRVYGKRLS